MPETKVPPSGTSYPPSLLVSKLKSDVTEEEIRKVFGGTGVISNVYLHPDEKDESDESEGPLWHAYVHYKKDHDGARLRATIDELKRLVEVEDKSWVVKKDRGDPACRVHVSGISNDVNDEALCEMFGSYGEVLACGISRDRNTGSPLSYGFVQYDNLESVGDAIEEANGQKLTLNGKEWSFAVGVFLSKKERFTNIRVENLSTDVTKDNLEKLFQKYGKTTTVCVVKDKKDGNKHYGFVNFKEHDEAVAAIDAVNGTELHGNKLSVAMALSRPRNKSGNSQKKGKTTGSK